MPFEIGVRAARSVAAYAGGIPAAQLALRGILDQPRVSAVIPGARNVSQVKGNAAAAALEPLSAGALDALPAIYDGGSASMCLTAGDAHAWQMDE